MALVTHNRSFGARKPYRPADGASDFDERRAELDWQYLSESEPVLDIMLGQLQKAANEIPREVIAVRKLPDWERRRSPVILDLPDLMRELMASSGALKNDGPKFAKLIVEIEDRMANAQRYAAEHEVHKTKPRP